MKPEDSQREYWNHIFNTVDSGIKTYRIENKLGAGIPDMLLCYRGVNTLIEFKVSHNKIKDGPVNIKHFNKNQVNFFLDNKSNNHLFILRVGDLDLVFMWKAIALGLNKRTLPELIKQSVLLINHSKLEGIHKKLNKNTRVKLIQIIRGLYKKNT